MLKEIEKRRSIRKFNKEAVKQETLEVLLRSAMQAPTAMNKQTWRVLVLQRREDLDVLPSLHPYANMMKSAGAAIIVMGDRTLNSDPYLYCDASAAIMNILLEATHLGLGSCWCAIAPSKERIDAFSNYFALSKELLPIAVIALGEGMESKGFEDRYDPAKVQWR